MTSTQPVRFIGRQRFARMPILLLEYLQARITFSMERDLSKAPTPISGGMRKALHKEQQAQSFSLRAVPRRVARSHRWENGVVAYHCQRYWCRHMMLFDMTFQEAVEADWSGIKCDKCGAINGKLPPPRWERELG